MIDVIEIRCDGAWTIPRGQRSGQNNHKQHQAVHIGTFKLKPGKGWRRVWKPPLKRNARRAAKAIAGRMLPGESVLLGPEYLTLECPRCRRKMGIPPADVLDEIARSESATMTLDDLSTTYRGRIPTPPSRLIYTATWRRVDP